MAAEAIAPRMAKLLNQSRASGQPSDFIPISILSVITTAFESHIHKQLYTYFCAPYNIMSIKTVDDWRV